MKIAIVAGHFMPEIGYQEVNIANVLAYMGHTVTVFTSARVSPQKKRMIQKTYLVGREQNAAGQYDILRLKTICHLGSMLISTGLTRAIQEFAPDIILVVGVGKLFPLPVYSKRFHSLQIATFWGDNQDVYEWRGVANRIASGTNMLVKAFIKKWAYRVAIKRSDLLIFYTPETESIVRRYCSKRQRAQLNSKKWISNLGFDPREYFYSETERIEIRNRYGIASDETVCITVTRITARKRIEEILLALDRLCTQGHRLRFFIIGFMDDEYGRSLKSFIAKLQNPKMVIALPVMNFTHIRAYYNAADIGIWMKAAISIQQAMGTGLFVVLPKKENVAYLVKEAQNGWLFSANNLTVDLDAILSNRFILGRLNQREENARINTTFLSYEAIMKQILAILGDNGVIPHTTKSL